MKLSFCSNCGNKNSYDYIDGNKRYNCNNCNTIHYQNPKPTATLICPNNNKILLVKRAYEPGKGLWGLPGGFIELNETPDNAATRELYEETRLIGKTKKYLGYSCHFNSIFGDILLLGIEMKINDFSTLEAHDDAEEAKFFFINQLPKLAFNCHKEIIDLYILGDK